MASGDTDKTEKPTPKKLREARKEGNVARSQDVSAWVGLLAASVIMPALGSKAADDLQTLVFSAMTVMKDPTADRAVAILGDGLRASLMIFLPLGALTVLVAVAATGMQGGLHLASKKIKPKFSHLSLIKGAKRLFGPMALWEAVKVVVKTTVLGVVLWAVVSRVAPQLIGLSAAPLSAALSTTGSAVLTLVRASIVAGLVMAVADYVVQKRRVDKQLRMSKHEVKQEMKQSEGDPLLKGAVRSRQMAMSRNRMMADIAQADVVVVNPTHVAVALRYEPGKGAPRVVAKGAGAVAAAIRARATEHRVPMVEDVPLARALHAACDIGQEVPAELYGAVAQVLAFVMSLRSRGAAAGIHRPPALTTRAPV
jgi:flagellar biosynthetic protein FlhB